MRLTLPLNAHALDMEQNIEIAVVLPGFTTDGRAHGTISLTTHLLTNGNVAVEFTVLTEDRRTIYAHNAAYRPDELITKVRSRRKTT